MILCSCNVITDRDISDIVVSFLRDDPWQVITPGKVYKAMAERGKCCSCFPGVIDIIVKTSTDYHKSLASPEAEVIDFVARLTAERQKMRAIKSSKKSRQKGLKKETA